MRKPECSAGIGDLKNLVAQRLREQNARVSDRAALRWTPVRAVVSLLGALLFAWAFLHLILALVFPRAATLH